MEFTSNALTNPKKSDVDEYQEIKIRQLESQFKFKFDDWLHGFAMTVRNPVRVYSWFVQSKKYWIFWDAQMKIMNFCDGGDEKNKWAEWGMRKVKNFLGKEIFEHFGRVQFQVNGVVVTEDGRT